MSWFLILHTQNFCTSILKWNWSIIFFGTILFKFCNNVDWRGFRSFLIIWNSLNNRKFRFFNIWLEFNISSPSWVHTILHFSAPPIKHVTEFWLTKWGKTVPFLSWAIKPPIFHLPCSFLFFFLQRPWKLSVEDGGDTGWKEHGFLHHHWEAATHQWGTLILVSKCLKDKLLLC